MTEILAVIIGVALMTLFVVGSLRFFTRIRDDRADPIINPSWTSDMRPVSPPPPLRDPDQTDRPEH